MTAGDNSIEQGILPSADFEVLLPPSLARFGPEVRANLHGADLMPLVVMLGGISGDRFPCVSATGENGWWSALAGDGRAVDPREYRILGIDFAADESGSYAPSTDDQAQVIKAALEAVGVSKAHAVIGASYGGMTGLSFAQQHPEMVERLVILSAGAEPHAASTAARDIQRRIVALGLAAGKGNEGLAIARGLAMTTYRSREEFAHRFRGGIVGEEALSPSEPGAYLLARGEAYRSVMSPGRFLSLSASIDRHRVRPEQIRVPALMIGSSTDQLVPPSQMTDLDCRYAGPSRLHFVQSLFGHDMFLKDVAEFEGLIRTFLKATP